MTIAAADVLIIGAGPVGLVMACEVIRHGLTCRVVDQAEAPSRYSKAQVVHSRTLEIFEDMGLVEPFLEQGRTLQGVTIYSPEQKRVAHLTFTLDSVETRYPHALSIPQRDTERILTAELARLGVTVERQVRLAGLRQDEGGVSATLEHLAEGREEQVLAPWLIGCDGAHSTVRKELGLSFEGATYEQRIMQADLRVDWSFQHPEDEVAGFLGKHGVLAAFPLPGERRYRLLTFLSPEEPLEPTLETFQRLLDERGPKGARVSDPAWMVDFRFHRRMVSRYREGRVFLAGDAAHIHSPAGGQGMNTGIQDAYNLAWKLALVQRGVSRPALLDSYQAERLPVAAATLKGTDQLTRRMGGLLSLRHPLALELRDQAIGLLTGLEMVQHRASRALSMLEVAYPDSPIVAEDRASLWSTLGRGRAVESPSLGEWLKFGDGPTPGERAADALLHSPLGEPRRLFEVLRGTRAALLLFDGSGATVEGYEKLSTIARGVQERYGRRVDIHLVIPRREVPAALQWDGSILLDEDGELHRRYGARGECLFLIRPDKYVGYRCQPADGDKLMAYLERALY